MLLICMLICVAYFQLLVLLKRNWFNQNQVSLFLILEQKWCHEIASSDFDRRHLCCFTSGGGGTIRARHRHMFQSKIKSNSSKKRELKPFQIARIDTSQQYSIIVCYKPSQQAHFFTFRDSVIDNSRLFLCVWTSTETLKRWCTYLKGPPHQRARRESGRPTSRPRSPPWKIGGRRLSGCGRPAPSSSSAPRPARSPGRGRRPWGRRGFGARTPRSSSGGHTS